MQVKHTYILCFIYVSQKNRREESRNIGRNRTTFVFFLSSIVSAIEISGENSNDEII